MVVRSMSEKEIQLFLNKTLANYFVLYIKTYRYRWFIYGEHAILYEQLFTELAADLRRQIELLANHIIVIGGKPFATMQKFVKEATIAEATADDEEEEIFSQLGEDIHSVIVDIETKGFPLAKKLDSLATTYILVQLQQGLQTYNRKILAYKDK